ncbi:ABC transporter ATP-binding protein [Paenibacillus radicis (ex Gao et al. 2016)]|uniref:Polysaccharide/polyol phosphate ABC transporter ATP-binding protein n=1 Tax=Paenibacillus radicis (ex Gao et al. 2016) TaxID=1737354 RepID=A0A917LX20_9BACL|nr:ABC transporter ATP-binding protein [Paenibacillus radicis (ex Gao et al. 2016)]GGG63327.1 polysaccharide/polyol phosphate ABC transporter ATP-binding protein [Paenibacillus radicis (ex Gao et al. 2016)]
MDKCYINLDKVDLYYPSHIYNATTLKQEIFSLLKLQKKKEKLDNVHALRNFSLKVNEGEKLGIIGHNGAGKSTLLKTIAGIYPIKSGSLKVKGEIRSLFDLALGFDLESTGRENIMYRGLLLGETPSSIKKHEEEIIDFAGLGEFIDYPIRSYSSGMLVRLAFAISTSISGEILLLDEIIGAGDASFAAKAKERMSGLMSEAKILVLVSHDLSTIKEVCNRVIMIKQGQIVKDGKPEDVIKYYQNSI